MGKYLLKRNLSALGLIAVLMFSCSGCVYLAVAGVGVVAGYVVSPDTVEGLTENDEQDLWDAAVEVASVMGVIEKQSEGVGEIEAKISGATVTITVEPLSPTTTKLSVKSRKYYSPKIGIAQDVFVKIMSHINE
ncbi:hypothetical protein ACFL49_01135 [Candidatus Omnitrophota bacterium]